MHLTNYTKSKESFEHLLSVEPLRDPAGRTQCFQATSLVLRKPGERQSLPLGTIPSLPASTFQHAAPSSALLASPLFPLISYAATMSAQAAPPRVLGGSANPSQQPCGLQFPMPGQGRLAPSRFRDSPSPNPSLSPVFAASSAPTLDTAPLPPAASMPTLSNAHLFSEAQRPTPCASRVAATGHAAADHAEMEDEPDPSPHRSPCSQFDHDMLDHILDFLGTTKANAPSAADSPAAALAAALQPATLAPEECSMPMSAAIRWGAYASN